MKKLLFAAVALLFAACTTDTTKDIAIEAPEILTASFEEDSRVQLNEEQKTVWTAGDCVSVFYRSDAHDKYEFQGETGDTDGTLKRVKRGTPSIGLDKVVAVYPYNDEYLIELQTGNIQAFLPDTQHYQKDSFGIGSSIMISSSRSDRLHLKNVCGWLKLQLIGEDVVKLIKLKGNNGEQLAGNIFITADDTTCTLAADLNEKYGDESGDLSGSLVDATTILTEITLDCGDGVTLTAEPTTFYIALPPQTFEGGFTVVAECADGSLMTKSTKNEVVIARNTIQPMDVLEYKADVPKNQIWYTSSDGEVVTPCKTYVFGANIVSNTYKNGQGIITFDNKVTSIGNYAFYGCSSLTSVTIGNSVTSIGEGAFSSCSSLSSVTIGNSVTSIGDYAFRSCSSLTSVTIPDSVTSIGRCAFDYCSSLTSVTIPDSVTSIGEDAFRNCSSLASVTIPDSVTSIGNHAFQYCSSLISVTIPDSVTSIGGSAFSGCSSLVSVTIPDSVTSIGQDAFSGCSSLASVTIPDSVTTLGNNPFARCSNLAEFNGKFASVDKRCLVVDGVLNSFAPAGLTEYTIPDSVTSIGGYAFSGCSSLAFITIPNSVTSIGDYAFHKCSSLASITIPDSVTSIGNSAFRNCSSLTSVTIPESVTYLGTNPFESCSKLAEFNGKFASADKRCLIVDGVLHSFAPAGLTEYTIPEGITSIGSSAFSGCSSLTSATIPENVISIGGSAFENCSRLKIVYCKPTTPPKGYTYMFKNNASGQKIYVPSASVNAYKTASYWRDYADAIKPYYL